MTKKQPALEAVGGGLKCDNPECDWIDMSIPVKDYKKWINAPCPKCGSNLLTEQDYKLSRMIHGLVKIVNFVYFFIPKKWLEKKLKKKYGKDFNMEDRAKMNISFDGSGQPIMGPIVKVEKENDNR